MISVQGTSGTLSHSDPLAVAIQSGVNPSLPRSAYARTDSNSASDDPFGEPHHRHIAYDSANKHVYQPFLTGPPASAGVKGGIDILDSHSGALRLRIFLPQQFLTDVDGLHGDFLTTDENGQRLVAITSSDGTPQHAALTIVQLAAVPLGIGTVTPTSIAATGGATLNIRGSGFQSATTATINEKSVSVTFKDAILFSP
jgi:hypothetical protein